MIRVGFVLDSRVPVWSECLVHKTSPMVMLNGWPSGSAIAVMRFGWMAEAVNRMQSPFRYELYRPWRRYDAVVFMKSMGPASQGLALRLRQRGVRTIFDANVDYFTPAWGNFRCDGLAPTAVQTRHAREMAEATDLIIGDSTHIATVAESLGFNAVCVTDNVRDDLIAVQSGWRPIPGKRLPLLWCGEAHKLYELLAIKPVLEERAERILLRIITNDLAATRRWRSDVREGWDELTARVPTEFIPWESVEALMRVYDAGGVFLSPRFMDNSYNLGHTEWKITLPMARGRLALCSEQTSYAEVSHRAHGKGIRICRSSDDWRSAFDELNRPDFAWEQESNEAITVVRQQYATSCVARAHVQALEELLGRGQGAPAG